MSSQKGHLPNFIIIGAMKCGTSTVHEQLARQPGVFMSTPKEPCFFSDDDQWNKGLDWYQSLFASAGNASYIGESSTHYTKLPSYPNTVARIKATLPEGTKFIYVQRDPIERLISHYIHEWTMGVINSSLEDALDQHPELIAYSQYERQLEPFLNAFGEDAIHVAHFEDLKTDPDHFFKGVKRFLNAPDSWSWDHSLSAQNPSSERLRKTPFLAFVQESKSLTWLRRTFLPQQLRDHLKAPYRFSERPTLGDAARSRLEALLKG